MLHKKSWKCKYGLNLMQKKNKYKWVRYDLWTGTRDTHTLTGTGASPIDNINEYYETRKRTRKHVPGDVFMDTLSHKLNHVTKPVLNLRHRLLIQSYHFIVFFNRYGAPDEESRECGAISLKLSGKSNMVIIHVVLKLLSQFWCVIICFQTQRI